MSVLSTFGDSRAFAHPLSNRTEGWHPLQGRAMSDHLISSLANGLRSTYEAQPETDIPDAFADLLTRLKTADE